jgi:hypothetical protein
VLTLLPLLLVKRWITQQLQLLSIRLVGDADVALILYFVIVLPGVVIHEVSHWLMALLLGIKVRKFSLGPVRKGRSQHVSLGSVQVAGVDPVRASLIGVAPLLGASAIILLIGNAVLGVSTLASTLSGQGLAGVLAGLGQMTHVADFWLWLYLIFSISNAMLPSDSDMSLVRPVLLFLGLVALVVLVVAGVPAIPETVVQWVNAVSGYLALAFGLTLATDLVFAIVMVLFSWLMALMLGR